ncbi:hypothetical protein TcWFU_009781 [Taenia crassiceps]|uniref:MSP domain-containing protein n=1 Tax=Taenia crassiceps TaxID=6207 RepID=A0ABR4QT21_9CEST
MDEAKVEAIQLHNPTPFPINWSDSRLQVATSAFELMPKSGRLQPDQNANVFVKYSPRIGGPVSEKIDLLLQESKAHVSITCQGVGLAHHLIVQPHEVEFSPLLPNGETDEQIVVIKNPCPFPVEFYSLDFDEVHTKASLYYRPHNILVTKQEEMCLTCLPLFDEAEEVLIPPRKPGESLPMEVFEHVLQIKQSSVGIPKTSRPKSSRRGVAKQALELFKKLPPHSSPFGGLTTFRRYAEARRMEVEGAGIVLLVFGSPLSGSSDLANSLAHHYDAAHLDLDEFFGIPDITELQGSEGDALSARLMSPDCTLGLVVSKIGNSKQCEVVLKALGKKRMNVFAVTVTRDLDSISLADARYEEALSKAERRAFERKVKEYRSLEEWQYDALPDCAREEVDSVLAEWKRQQQRKNKDRNPEPKSLVSSVSSNEGRYADLKTKLNEFVKEHRKICHLLSIWDIKNQEQNPNGSSQPPVELNSPKLISSYGSDDNLVGIPHFVVHSKLDIEIEESLVTQAYECPEDVKREEPNILIVLNKLLPQLPTREEIRRQLGYGPLPIDRPTPVTFSIVRRPVERERCGEVHQFFTIVKSSCLMEANEATEGSQIGSRLFTTTSRSQRTLTGTSSRAKQLQGKSSLANPGQNACESSAYRWVVPGNGQIQLSLKFAPNRIGDFRELLRFEVLRTKEEFKIECRGCCQLPQLVIEPRMVFSKVEECCLPDKPPRKTFILDKNCFHFGPLLAAKSRDRILAGEYRENITELRLQNYGSHSVDVKLTFEDNESGENFAVSPSELHISRDEDQVAKVYALPTTIVYATSKLIGWIKNNPEPFKFDFSVIGVLPNLTVQTKVVNFGKVPLNKTERQKIVIRNPTLIPVAWKCEVLEPTKEMSFTVYPTSGILDSFDELGSITVEYNGSSDLQKIAIKRWLRFIAMDTRGLSNPVTIHPPVGVQVEAVDPEFEIVIPKGGLDFGLIRVQEESKKSLELRNHGPFKLQYNFRPVLPQKKQVDLQKALTISPQGGILLPSQNLIITHEMEVYNEFAFICEVETHKGVQISSNPIPISARVRRSHFKILPSKEVSFGMMVVNTQASEQVTIENDGAFALYYSILFKKARSKARSVKHKSSQTRSLGTGAKERISQGPFVVFPTRGTISIGQKQPITVQCSTGPIKAIFDEELVIRITDKPNSAANAINIPFGLSVEVCTPSLEMKDMTLIFEEHSVCQSRRELERLASHGVVGTAYIEDENCFDFGVTPIGGDSIGRFRIFNNSMAAVDVSYILRQVKPERRRKDRRNDFETSEAFDVVPKLARIGPYQSIYVSCSFAPKSSGVYSTSFQVLVDGKSVPLLQFNLRGAGEIPHIGVEEPTIRNSQGNLYLLFNKNQTSQAIRMRNQGSISCQVIVDLEVTGGHFEAFGLSDPKFRRKDVLTPDDWQTSVNFALAVGETRSLEVTFIPMRYKNGGRVTGCVTIYSQGNDYEKEVIELCGYSPTELVLAPQIHLMDSTTDPSAFEEINMIHMNLGDCYVGSTISKSLVLSYPNKIDEVGLTTPEENELPSFTFAWPQDHPHLKFEPSTGKLHPGSSLIVFVKFCSDRPVIYRLAPAHCELMQASKTALQKDDTELVGNEAVDKTQLCVRSAETLRRRVRESSKSRNKSLSARLDYPQKTHSKGSVQLNVVGDEKETKEDRRTRVLYFYFTIACDFVEYLCEVNSIQFADTPLYCKVVKPLHVRNAGRVTMTFRLEKVDDGDELFEVDTSESLIPPGKSIQIQFTFRPTHSGEHECDFILRVPFTADESTASKGIHVIGRGVSIPIHLQIPNCDYEARHLPADPLWYRAQTLMMVGTGIGYKVARSFEITNASEDSVEFNVKKVDPSDRTMEIVPSTALIKPGDSTDVKVFFMSQTKETKEVCVIFEANSHRTSLLLVGQTKEAVVAFDRSHLHLPELPVGREVVEVVHLVNTEAIPIKFKIHKSTLHCNESLNKLSILPMGGCIKPNERFPLEIHFLPTEERRCNFNILCKVEHRQRDLRLNVKTDALKCSATVWLLDDCSEAIQAISPFLMQCMAKDVKKSTAFASRRVADFPSLRENLTIVDFGEVLTGCDATRLLKLSNHSDYEVEFGTLVTSTLQHASVPFRLTPDFGKVGPLKETLLQIAFKPDSPLRVPTQTTNFLGVITILNGPAFALNLRGRVTVSPIDISPSHLNFGPQFTQQTGLGAVTKCVKISNKSLDNPVYVAFLSSTLPNFACDFSPQMIKPTSTVNAKVTFYPSACKNYESELCFVVNEKVKIKVPVRGRGVKLNVEINCGSLMVNQGREGMSKTPVKVKDSKQSNSSVVYLGNLTFMQTSRRTVKIMNKSPAPISITGVSVVPKSKALNKVLVNASTSKLNALEILSLNLLPPLPFARGVRGNFEFNRTSPPTKDPTAQIEVIFAPQDLPIMPFSEEVLLRVSNASNPDKCVWIPGFTICGKCTGAKMVLETPVINFGIVVVGSSCCKTIAISNHGNESARFMWDEKTLPRHVVSVEPKRGSIHPNTSMNFNFTLKPLQVNQELYFENVTCNIERSEPLRVTLTGVCSASPEVAEVVKFACAVRETDTQSVSLSNPTNSVWTVKPVFDGIEWSGKRVFEVLPKGSAGYAITYHPLTMTSADEVHKGSIFFPLPNGSGVKYHLEGTSNPPNALNPRVVVEIPCKRKVDLQIDVPNWLSRLQRFCVSWKTSNESSFTFTGPQFIDVPGGASKRYPLSCLSLGEASTTLKVTFSNMESGEYQFAEYQLRVIRPIPEGLIKLKAPLRKAVTYQLPLENPLRRDTVVTLHSTLPELTCPPEYKLTSQSKSLINLDFKPWRIGKFIGSLEVSSSELGFSVYDLNLEALEPLPERLVRFRTSLGQCDTSTVKIVNLSQSRAEFSCKTTNAAFRCERSVLVASNSSVGLPVTFEPNRLGALEGTLKVTSSQAGSFIFPLHGLAKLPTPQGPFLVTDTAATLLTVRNVFPEPIEFTIKVNNTAFRVECSQKVVNPQNDLKISVTLEPCDYTSNLHGALVASCIPSTQDLPIQWVFYLKGVTATPNLEADKSANLPYLHYCN